MKKYVCVFFLIFLSLYSVNGQQPNHRKDSIALRLMKPVKVLHLEIPECKADDTIVTHTGFSLLYNENHEQAVWVAYELSKEKTVKIAPRTNKFIVDPKVKTGTATNNDYKNSGYDRGHLAPAADMGWSYPSMKESFYFSNMSPQVPGFNRGIWKNLEELVRTWAVENEKIYIVTGPILTDNLPTIGQNNVSVPSSYYKVILDYTLPEIKAIAFVIPNNASKLPLQSYVVTIDKLEKITGIDFFPLLPDEQERIIERTVCNSLWSW
ncbi:MAG: DNA/RNA non-specific endonuclease [Bacteroidales bacterium]|jgi:endonuclease G|nr:DNA/RNA non-specific endonuclease [Bacteroidales bacterium]